MDKGGRVARFTARAPGGKTVTAVLVLDSCRVADARLSGDFFVYPEEALELLERRLRGCSSGSCVREAVEAVAEAAQAIGFTWSWLADALERLYTDACRSYTGAAKP